MILGIVGSEEKKFTPLGILRAKSRILNLFDIYDPEEVVSGACPLGGIDIWTEELARQMNRRVKVFPPKFNDWNRGFKPRNIKIAERSDLVICITIDKLPEDFSGLKFPFCYHCLTGKHVKSGGCWTMKYARSIGKQVGLLVVRNT